MGYLPFGRFLLLPTFSLTQASSEQEQFGRLRQFSRERAFIALVGDLILLSERRGLSPRAACGRRAAQPTAFFFDVSCPFSYIAAERVERLLGPITWIPAAAVALHRGQTSRADEDWETVRAAAERRAAALRLPLMWPENHPTGTPIALRAAAHAAENGVGGAFALALSRLAFCGGFDIKDSEILAEAAAAAGLRLDLTLAAAADESLHATARGLLARGASELPAIRVGRRWFSGEQGLLEASAAMRRGAFAFGPPLAPVG
jgi:2-hydroxychromene-2-carboxylate isomerase